MNRRVDIQGDIKRYQDTLSYALSKVDYSVGEHLYMLPSDMTLKIRLGTVGYNNKILISDGNFSLGKNDEVNSLEAPSIKSHKTNSLETPAIKNHKTNSLETPAIKNHKTNSLETPAIESQSNTTQGLTHAPTISDEDEKAAFILFIIGGFTVWFLFRCKSPILQVVFNMEYFLMNTSLVDFGNCSSQIWLMT